MQPAGAGRGVALGCLGVFLAVVLGFMLMAWQERTIVDAWTYCSDQAAQVAIDTSPRLAAEVAFDRSTVRLLVYIMCFPVGFGLGRLFMWGRSRRAAIAVGCLLGVAVCAAVFVGDFALNNGEVAGAYLPGRCPGGRPPWWFSWLPMRVG
ncbi:hypothetical protein GCM10010441_21520 [Kitasatospora paracochleata]